MEKTLDFTYTDIASFNDAICIVFGADLANTELAWPQWLIDYHSFHGVSSNGEPPADWVTVGTTLGGKLTRTTIVNDNYHTNHIIQPDDAVMLLNDNTLRVIQRDQYMNFFIRLLSGDIRKLIVSLDKGDHTDETGYWSDWDSDSDQYSDIALGGWPSYTSDDTDDTDEEEHTHLGWQLTTAKRIDNSDWPDWLQRAWQKDSEERGSVQPYPRGTGTGLVSITTSAGQRTVDWCDWIVYNTKTESLGVCSNQFYVEVLGGA